MIKSIKHLVPIGMGLVLAICTLVILGGVLLFMKQTAVAQTDDCPSIYNPGNGWAIDMCPGNSGIALPMEIVIDGVSQSETMRMVRIYHQSENDSGVPQVMVLYASGYIRLKQNADPNPPNPFGSSFVLGPGYWASGVYHHNPQLGRVEIDTSRLPLGPLQMKIIGKNGNFDVEYDLTLPPPRDRQTRLHVNQVYTATSDIVIDVNRRSKNEGFKLVQYSSMFVNEDGTCIGGHMYCHDSNGFRYIDNDLVRHEELIQSGALSHFFVHFPQPLGSTWLDLLHTDDVSWQGNTPNLRIALDELPDDHTITPNGWLQADTNPNHDNVGLWLHDDGPASQSWTAAQTDQVSYWLLAQDDPLDPWADLDLRTGETFLDFDGTHNCVFVNDAGQSTSGSLEFGSFDFGLDNHILSVMVSLRNQFDPFLLTVKRQQTT